MTLVRNLWIVVHVIGFLAAAYTIREAWFDYKNATVETSRLAALMTRRTEIAHVGVFLAFIAAGVISFYTPSPDAPFTTQRVISISLLFLPAALLTWSTVTNYATRKKLTVLAENTGGVGPAQDARQIRQDHRAEMQRDSTTLMQERERLQDVRDTQATQRDTEAGQRDTRQGNRDISQEARKRLQDTRERHQNEIDDDHRG